MLSNQNITLTSITRKKKMIIELFIMYLNTHLTLFDDLSKCKIKKLTRSLLLEENYIDIDIGIGIIF